MAHESTLPAKVEIEAYSLFPVNATRGQFLWAFWHIGKWGQKLWV